ncbi:unnamed protein product, partial [Ectocarpus fasciculatus]
MRSSALLLLLLWTPPSRVSSQLTDSTTTITTTTTACEDPSQVATCNGIQGTGKNADICCASECVCTCGGASTENTGKECFLGQIRETPPDWCTGEEDATKACALPPTDPVDATPCGVTDGVLSDDGFLCCPTGCGTCGGSTCSSIPLSWVMPGDTPLSVDTSVPDGATSADYCCYGIFETTVTECGAGVEAPCRMPQEIETKVDTCGVDGIVGTAGTGNMCCPLGCAICAGTGCGDQHISYVFPGELPWSTTAPEGSETQDFCCLKAFRGVGECGVDGAEPPCLIPEVVETLAPRDLPDDNCGVDGIQGIRSGDNCCPLGCGQCGGTGCGSIDMGYITPYLDHEPAVGATSSSYCCSSSFTVDSPTCGDGVSPPCLISAENPETVTATLAPEVASTLMDTCGLPGMPGIMDTSGARCCPSGCGMCGGPGCGSIDMNLVAPTVEGDVPVDAKSGDYCCTSGVDIRDVTCGTGADEGYPPCLIPAGELTVTATLAPDDASH